MNLNALVREARACQLCAESLPHPPRPVFQYRESARILIAGQAPGRKVHESGVPFDDASGARLREWLGLHRDEFYDPAKVCILPMGFCYPGKGKSGDLPPIPQCANTWRQRFLSGLRQLQLTLVIGQYALAYHLPEAQGSLTEIVRSGPKGKAQDICVLPHPSPRNNIWLKRNPWFEAEIVPLIQRRVRTALCDV